MEREQFTGNWNILQGKIKQQWGKLTDDEIALTQGKRDEIVGTIQKKYGGTKEEISRQLDKLMH